MPLVGAMADTAGLFLAYSSLQNVIRDLNHEDPSQKRQLTISEIGLAATGAGFLSSFILWVLLSSPADNRVTCD
jgi:ornithine carrier protein